jgi:transcriptional regulator with XRE-family HTH domain
MSENPYIGSDALAFLESIIPDTPETRRIEKQERFRFALTQAMRDLRNRVGLTQKELAQRLGIGQSWVSKLESANNDHTFESVLAYLDALDANFQALILLRTEEVAKISSDPSFSLEINISDKVTGESLSRESESPEFKSIPLENRSKFGKVQSLVSAHGLWGISEGVAA